MFEVTLQYNLFMCLRLDYCEVRNKKTEQTVTTKQKSKIESKRRVKFHEGRKN
jgi:hypothetical protein